ncbi:MAG: asparagine synthase-related protein, partial [Chromatiaceae bacterium]
LAAFRRWGETCPERLLGDFVFAVWDLAERRLFLARDALGGRGLCYHFDGRRCLFASEIGQILDSPDWEARINEGKVADYLADLTHEQEETFFQSILYVAPAHSLTITGQGTRKRRYWDIDPEARIRYRDDREYAEHFREILTAATRCRMRSIGPIGLSLSGGLDSTLLAAITTGLLPRTHPTQSRLKTFSYVFDPHKASDEREYILPVAERYGLDAHYLPCDDKWALRDLPRWPVERDYIWCEAYSWLVVAVAEAARAAGCRVLLSGLYGDELFLGGDYWAAELLREWRFRELFRHWRANSEYVCWQRDLMHHGLRQLLPAGLKRNLRRLKPRPAHHAPPPAPTLRPTGRVTGACPRRPAAPEIHPTGAMGPPEHVVCQHLAIHAQRRARLLPSPWPGIRNTLLRSPFGRIGHGPARRPAWPTLAGPLGPTQCHARVVARGSPRTAIQDRFRGPDPHRLVRA